MSYKETTELFDVLGDHEWCDGDMLTEMGNFIHSRALIKEFEEYLRGVYHISVLEESSDEDDSDVESNDDDEEENEPVYGEYNITLYEESL